MSRIESVELTTLCLIYDENRILLQNRIKKDWKGYTLPGGHVEPGESIVAAVIREMKEETGLTIRHPQLCGVKQFPIKDDGHGAGRYLVFLFKTNQFEGDLVSSEEGKMEWVRRDELANVPAVNDLEDLLQVMERDHLTEFQYVIEGSKWVAKLV